MNSPIKTNQLSYKFDKESFSKIYDVFCVSTSEKYFKHGAYILDAPLLDKNVRSVLFKSGSEFYVLMKCNYMNLSLLKEAISESEGAENTTISKTVVDELTDDIVLQLLLNSLGSYETSSLRFNNLTGHLYCFHPAWIIKEKRGKVKVYKQVPCLELKISPELRLNIEVQTFTSVLWRKEMEFPKRKFEEYPKYVFSAKNTLRRKLKDDKEEAFIMHQIKDERTNIPFLNIKSLDHFNKSKMGILTTVLEDFNSKFSDIAHLEFTCITDYKSLDYDSSVAKENKQAIAALLSKRPIKIVDCIGDDNSEMFCDNIRDLLLSEFKIKASIGKRNAKECLNIRLIHNADYYKGINDKYQVFDDTVVQHITSEGFPIDIKHAKHALSSVIHEMLIKDDLLRGRISLFDWQSLGIEQDIDFGIKEGDEESSKYFFMTVHPDGTFEISEQTLNLFEHNEYFQCMEIFDIAKRNSEEVRGIIKDTSGNINIIKDTGWFTIPEIERIKAELSSGNTKLRNKEKLKELFSSSIDIKLFNDGSSQYYFVGAIGRGMDRSINSAANIRKIEAFKDSKLIFDKLLPLMNVTFVHNGQLTIMPFPFKYLREHVNRLVSNN